MDESLRFPGFVVSGRCELPGMGVRTPHLAPSPPLVFFENTKLSYPWSHQFKALGNYVHHSDVI